MSDNNPTIAVCIPSYKRPKIVNQAVFLLKKHLKYDGPIRYYVSVDAGLGLTRHQFRSAYNFLHVEVVRGPGKGLGANLNHLLEITEKHPLIMMLDDDHHL